MGLLQGPHFHYMDVDYLVIGLFETFLIYGLISQHFTSNIGIVKSKIREKEPII